MNEGQGIYIDQPALQEMIDDVTEKTETTIGNIEIAGKNYIEYIKNNWEDGHAMEFSSKFAEKMNEIAAQLARNVNTFLDAADSAAGRYCSRLEIPKEVHKTDMIFNEINFGQEDVKEKFADSGKSGLLKGKETTDYIQNQFEGIKNGIKNSIEEIVSAANGEAFGDEIINDNTRKALNKIVEILDDHQAFLNTKIKETMEDITSEYLNTASSAAQDLDISSSSENG